MLITSLLLSVLTCNPGFAYHLNAHSALPLGEVKVFTVHASNQRMRAAKIMNPHTSLLTRYNLSVTFTPAVWGQLQDKSLDGSSALCKNVH